MAPELSNRLGAQQILRLNKMQHINAGYMCFNKKSNLNSEKVDFFDEIGKNHQFLTLIFPTMISGTKYSVSLTKSCF